MSCLCHILTGWVCRGRGEGERENIKTESPLKPVLVPAATINPRLLCAAALLHNGEAPPVRSNGGCKSSPYRSVKQRFTLCQEPDLYIWSETNDSLALLWGGKKWAKTRRNTKKEVIPEKPKYLLGKVKRKRMETWQQKALIFSYISNQHKGLFLRRAACINAYSIVERVWPGFPQKHGSFSPDFCWPNSRPRHKPRALCVCWQSPANNLNNNAGFTTDVAVKKKAKKKKALYCFCSIYNFSNFNKAWSH